MSAFLKTCLLLFLPFSLAGQQSFTTVDRDAVKKAVEDSTLDTYYPKLVARLDAFDTTLTNDDHRLLYYGFVFQETYTPYSDSQREIRTLIDEEKYEEAVGLCDSVLAVMPVSLSGNYYKGLALFMIDENDPEVNGYRSRYINLRNAILSSGNGLSCETAFKTITVPDEYDIMYKYFEITGFKEQALVGDCDVFQITPSEYFKKKKIYFDTSESLRKMGEMLREGR